MSGKTALLLDLFYTCINLSVWKTCVRKDCVAIRFVSYMHKSECVESMSGKTALLLDLVLHMHNSAWMEILCQERQLY